MKYEGSREASEVIRFISDKNFIMREQGSGTRAEMELFLSRYGLSEKELKAVAYFGNTQGIVEAVSQGMGISFVSKAAAQIYTRLDLINVVEIDSELLSRNIFYVQKKDMMLTPAQELFITYAKNCYQNI